MSRPVPPVTASPASRAASPEPGYSSTETIANRRDIVFKGPFRDRGMPDFTGKLTEADVVKIQAFIQDTANAIRPK